MPNTVLDTVKRIFVKVYGFSDAERHALNTGFRLSAQRDVSYALWTTDAQQSAEMVLLDGESWEASLELANPENDGLRLIWVGSRPPAQAWKVFAGPLHWSALLQAMDQVYRPNLSGSVYFDKDREVDFSSADTQPLTVGLDGSSDDCDAATVPMPLGLASPSAEELVMPSARIQRVLLVDADFDERLYWRAKLAAAEFFFVDEAATAETARSFLAFNVYSLVIVDLDSGRPDVWKLVKDVMLSKPAIKHLLITRKGLNSLEAVRAWFAGAHTSFAKPVQPGEVKKLLAELQYKL